MSWFVIQVGFICLLQVIRSGSQSLQLAQYSTALYARAERHQRAALQGLQEALAADPTDSARSTLQMLLGMTRCESRQVG